MSRLIALIVLLTASAMGARAFQQRDAPAPSTPAAPRAGTATIAGVVVTDGEQKQPLRRATVTLSETSQASTRTMATDEAGRFAFRALPAGRYLLIAAKGAYLTTPYGSKAPPRVNAASSGTAIVIVEGQQVADLTIRLARGGVVAGTVRDAGGRPAAGARISVEYYFRLPTGERTLGGAMSAVTDDRGAYRIFGIAPGDYVVSAQPPISAGAIEMLTTTDGDLQRAQNVLSGRATSAPPPTPTRRHESVWFAPAYYPGTSVLAEATVISIAAGEERMGLDFQWQLVPTARVEGTVIGVNGQPVANVTVQLVSSRPPISQVTNATTDAQGRFRFSGVQPASSSIVIRTNPAGASPGQAPQSYFGQTDIEVRGEDITSDIRLQQGATVSGRVVLDPTVTAPSSELSRLRIALTPMTTAAAGQLGVRVMPIQPDGSFQSGGFAPGRYRVQVTTQSGPPLTSMFVKSAVFGGQDVLDAPLEVEPGRDITGATVTFTERTADISGRMLDATGAPAPEYYVIAFSSDSRYWAPFSRRIQQVRPARDGSFVFRNLPPGDYLINAVTEVEQGEWFDPEFLKQLLAGAVKLSVAEGEKKVQDFRAGGR